ncbi:deoxyhypusine synthase [Candidatus Micrarchaeota archaeon]|nr:deoxyhypusine synthase [Candidatus Micrarchaeota archaeon]
MQEVKDLPQECESIRELTENMGSTGFQATHIKEAIELIKRMKQENATIFLSFTSNIIATGLRSIIAGMVKKGYVDVIITTGGSLDHDFIRTEKNYFISSFDEDDEKLRGKGFNRLGNVLIPNDRYMFLEKKMKEVFTALEEEGPVVAPSDIAKEIGKRIKDENSFLYQAYKGEIPVFSPGITDSAIGLQTYFFKQMKEDFGIDVTKDMKNLAEIVLNAKKTGGIIIGGGISKHHTIGVNLLRDGMDYAVYLTTASSWDGSLSGAHAKEAVSWGKIKKGARCATVHGEATTVLPLIYYSL